MTQAMNTPRHSAGVWVGLGLWHFGGTTGRDFSSLPDLQLRRLAMGEPCSGQPPEEGRAEPGGS